MGASSRAGAFLQAHLGGRPVTVYVRAIDDALLPTKENLVTG
ncbi:MAG: hypothetical protein ACREFP_18265 [Acetobacteraceae bacterium]